MPTVRSRRKAAVVADGRLSKRKTGRSSSSSKRQTLSRQPSRVNKNALGKLKGRPQKKRRTVGSEDDHTGSVANSGSDSDFVSERSGAVDDSDGGDGDAP